MKEVVVVLAVISLASLVCLCSSLPAQSSKNIDDEVLRQLQSLHLNRKALAHMKNLLGGVEDSMRTIRKRTCLFNAGMSHSCDYKDIMGLIGDTSYWGSDMSPGKRRKREESPIMTALGNSNA